MELTILFPDDFVCERGKFSAVFAVLSGLVGQLSCLMDLLQLMTFPFIYPQKAEFQLNKKDEGFILSAFSFGYGFSCFTGFIVYKFGGVTMYGIGVVLTGILAILSPVLIRLHLFVFLFARALQGVFEVGSFRRSRYVYIVDLKNYCECTYLYL